jgi:hypothetical protein
METTSEQTELENESEDIEDAESTIEPSPPAKQAATGPNPLNIGFALVLAFAIGLALGFFGRPRIIEDVPVQVVVTVVPDTNNTQAVASNNNSGATDSAGSAEENNNSAVEPESETGAATSNSEPSVDPNAPPTPTIMDFLMSDARHIQGDEAAPVTIIEFSDFK